MIVQYLRSEKLFMAAVVIQDEANMKTAEQQVRAGLFTLHCCRTPEVIGFHFGATAAAAAAAAAAGGRAGGLECGGRGERRGILLVCGQTFPSLPSPSTWRCVRG